MGKYVDINIEGIGKYRIGLTTKEIKQYLKDRAKNFNLKVHTNKLWSAFGIVAGPGNTMGVEWTDCCKKEVCLMYRHDVERFADVMFLGKSTYFD